MRRRTVSAEFGALQAGGEEIGFSRILMSDVNVRLPEAYVMVYSRYG